MPTVRPYHPADRPAVLAIVGNARAIDTPNNHIHLAHEGNIFVGLAIGVAPDAALEAYLGDVVTTTPYDWPTVHALIAALIQQAIQLGFQRGYASVRDPRTVRHLTDTFGLTPEPSGWQPNTGTALQWDFHVHLQTFLDQLHLRRLQQLRSLL